MRGRVHGGWSGMREDCYDHDDERSWSMVSSSGRDRVVFKFEGLSKRHHTTGTLVCSIRVRGRFWDRSGALCTGAGLVNDYDVSLPQVAIEGRSLVTLHRRMIRWFDGYRPLRVGLSSSEEGNQATTVRIGKNPVLTYRPEKQAYSLFYTDGVTSVRCPFVVDQSCIRLGAGSLGRALRRLGLLPSTGDGGASA